MQTANKQKDTPLAHRCEVRKAIKCGTEMCQEFRHVSVSLVLAVCGSGLPFIRKIDK